jgi:hypothetical protein
MVVEVIAPPLPKPNIVNIYPANDTVDFPIDGAIIITFDLPMDILSFKEGIQIDPKRNFVSSWSDNNKKLEIQFHDDLDYYTIFTLTILYGSATNGESLVNAPYFIVFRTVTGPPPRTLDITYPTEGLSAIPNQILTITGTSTGFDPETTITIEINEQTVHGVIKHDGTWSVDLKLPSIEAQYQIIVKVGELNSTVNIEIQSPVEPDDKKDGDDNNGFLGMGLMVDGLIVIIIIIIIVLILFIIIRKKKTESYVDDDFLIKEEASEESDEDEE